MQRYSKKREAILACLRGTTEHPTAEWVYTRLKPRYPDLSFATVYRNLLQLKEAGLVRSVGTVQGQERFDADVSTHAHAVCVRCGKILDIEKIDIPPEMIRHVERETGFSVSYAGLRFTGLCGACREVPDTADGETGDE